MSLLLAQNRHAVTAGECPFLGVKRTSPNRPPMLPFGPGTDIDASPQPASHALICRVGFFRSGAFLTDIRIEVRQTTDVAGCSTMLIAVCVLAVAAPTLRYSPPFFPSGWTKPTTGLGRGRASFPTSTTRPWSRGASGSGRIFSATRISASDLAGSFPWWSWRFCSPILFGERRGTGGTSSSPGCCRKLRSIRAF